MTPDQRTLTNRANAQKSTGPKTPAGKQRSALNATRHGLTGQVTVMPQDDLAAYTAFIQTFHRDLKPSGALETQLVQMIADASWRLNRATAYETNLLTLAMQDQSQPFDAFALAQACEAKSKSVSLMSMYFQRTSRQLEKTAAQLRALQVERLERERTEMFSAMRVLSLHNYQNRRAKTPVPYNPQDHGFVFSLAQIEAGLNRQNRIDEACRFIPTVSSAAA